MWFFKQNKLYFEILKMIKEGILCTKKVNFKKKRRNLHFFFHCFSIEYLQYQVPILPQPFPSALFLSAL